MQGQLSDRVQLRTNPAGLVLMGGGARAAYQVGVLKAIAELLRDGRRGLDPSIAQGQNPFQIVVGTSAGAINAAALACRSDNFQEAVAQLVHVWENFHAEHVYRADFLDALRSGARWLTLLSLGWMIRRSLRLRPKSLLDNQPLSALLQQLIDLPRLARAIEHGHLRALAVTASSYSSGRHITFYQSLNDHGLASKLQREFVFTPIEHDHLLASSAIPFVFPAVPLKLRGRHEFYGDGSMRQIAPISPAIHLGAERVLVIAAGQLGNPGVLGNGQAAVDPSLAQIAGHAMASIFLDALASDIERLDHMNKVAVELSLAQQRALRIRPIQSLVIAPSERLDGIALRHLTSLPRSVRVLLDVLGARAGTQAGAAGFASYLLFESTYTCVLIDLGFADTMRRRDEVLAFLVAPRSGSTHGFKVVVE